MSPCTGGERSWRRWAHRPVRGTRGADARCGPLGDELVCGHRPPGGSLRGEERTGFGAVAPSVAAEPPHARSRATTCRWPPAFSGATRRKAPHPILVSMSLVSMTLVSFCGGVSTTSGGCVSTTPRGRVHATSRGGISTTSEVTCGFTAPEAEIGVKTEVEIGPPYPPFSTEPAMRAASVTEGRRAGSRVGLDAHLGPARMSL